MHGVSSLVRSYAYGTATPYLRSKSHDGVERQFYPRMKGIWLNYERLELTVDCRQRHYSPFIQHFKYQVLETVGIVILARLFSRNSEIGANTPRQSSITHSINIVIILIA